MDKAALVSRLNEMLAQEHACAIRYATHAAVVEGPYAETVKARLKEIAGDEVRHAEMLRDRILALGGEPEMHVRSEDLIPAKELTRILEVNIQEEKDAIKKYKAVLSEVEASNAILFQSIQDIIKDEQEHLEELETLTTSSSK